MDTFKVMAVMSLQDLFSNPLQRICAQMKGAEKTSSGLTSKLASLGKAILPLTIAASAFLGVIGYATSKTAEFEQSLAGASTLFGSVAVDTKNLSDKILSLSTSTGIAATEIGNTLYNALSAGIPVTEDMGAAMDFMTKSARLSKAGFTDIDTAVQATASVLNAYKMNVSETDRVHKILMQTQNNGITTIGELGQTLSQVTPTAAAMGISFEQVGASLSNLTAAKIPASVAATQLNAIIAELGKQGTIAQKNLMGAAQGTQYAGKSFQELMKAGVPLSEILDMMSAYAGKSGKSLIDMFSSIDAGKAALVLSGENTEQFTKNLAAMGTTADVVGDAYNKVTDTLQESLKRFSASKDALFISIGSLFTPVLKVVSVTMSKIVSVITAITKTTLGAFLLKAAAGISALIVGLSALIGVFFLLKLSLAPVIASLSAILWPILAIGAAAAVLYIAFKNNFGGIADIVGNLWTKISLTVKGVIAVFKSLKDGVGEIKGALADDIKANGLIGVVTTLSKVIYRLWQFISGFVEVISGAFSEVFAQIEPLISAVSDAFSLLGSAVGFILSKFNLISGVANTNVSVFSLLGKTIATVVVTPFKILGSVISIAATILQVAVNNIRAIVTFITDLFNGVSLFDAGKKLLGTFGEGILSVINKPKEILMNGLSSLRKLLPFSDAKEGPLSTLTLSGERMMTTLATGVDKGAPILTDAANAAFEDVGNAAIAPNITPSVPDVSFGLTPVVDKINPNVPDIDMGVRPVLSNIDIPEYETSSRINQKAKPEAKNDTVIQIHINDISLPSVKDGGSFIDELRSLALSLGVK